MDRKLASIQIIRNIQPIENADNIERVDILGWHLVAKKEEFEIGDKCIYCEVDSVLPDRPEFEFLKSKNFRIKTIKLRGQISQGICFPLSIIDSYFGVELKEGDGLTEFLGVTKYEIPVSVTMSGKVKNTFPDFLPKTDEIRIQSVPEILERYRNTICYVTEKVDGCSITVYLRDGEFNVASRRMVYLDTPENIWWQISHKLDLENRLKSLGKNIAIQGEVLGNIQGNKYKLKENRVLWFNAFDIDNQEYLPFVRFIDLIKDLGLETVPILETNFILDKTVDELVEYSKGVSKLFNIYREGVVIRPLTEKQDNDIGRLSFKVVNPDFLLKFE